MRTQAARRHRNHTWVVRHAPPGDGCGQLHHSGLEDPGTIGGSGESKTPRMIAEYLEITDSDDDELACRGQDVGLDERRTMPSTIELRVFGPEAASVLWIPNKGPESSNASQQSCDRRTVPAALRSSSPPFVREARTSWERPPLPASGSEVGPVTHSVITPTTRY